MKRDFRFRAWDKKGKKMIYVDPVSSFPLMMTWDGTVYKQGIVQDYIMMQYTGFKDRKSVEIYEGDILEYREDRVVYETGQVSFDLGCFWLCGQTLMSLDLDEMWIIIGNIYKNPKLLER